MKKTFYIYWAWYICITLYAFNLSLTLEQAKLLTVAHHLSQVLLVTIPMSYILVMQNKLDDVDWKYFEGCLISFILRGLSYIFGVYDVGDKYILTSLAGMVIGLWYIFNLKTLLNHNNI